MVAQVVAIALLIVATSSASSASSASWRSVVMLFAAGLRRRLLIKFSRAVLKPRLQGCWVAGLLGCKVAAPSNSANPATTPAVFERFEIAENRFDAIANSERRA